MRCPPRISGVYHRLGLLRAYLIVNGAGCVVGGTFLIALPDRLITGPSMAVILRYLGRTAWGCLFLLVGVLCLVGAARKRGRAGRVGLVGLLGLQTTWALGLTAPIFIEGRANALAPVAWVILASSTVLVAVITGGLAPRARG
jgi:hypothetical protein